MNKLIMMSIFIFLCGNIAAHEEHHIEPNNSDQANRLFSKALASQSEDDFIAAYKFIKQESVQAQRGGKFKLAYLQQHFHDFDKALVTLASLESSPQTNLLKASIYLTQGKVSNARSACSTLIGKVDNLLATTCIAKSMSRNGQWQQAYGMLRSMITQQAGTQLKPSNTDSVQWAYATLAEIALQLNKTQVAENYYQKVLRLKPTDVVSRIEYADFLINMARYEDAVTLTANHTNNTTIFIRFVRANRALNKPTGKDYRSELKYAVLAMKNRNLHLHYDTLAEYSLFIENKPHEALKWSKLHWAQQKTPRDALLLEKSARAANDIVVLEEIDGWRKQLL